MWMLACPHWQDIWASLFPEHKFICSREVKINIFYALRKSFKSKVGYGYVYLDTNNQRPIRLKMIHVKHVNLKILIHVSTFGKNIIAKEELVMPIFIPNGVHVYMWAMLILNSFWLIAWSMYTHTMIRSQCLGQCKQWIWNFTINWCEDQIGDFSTCKHGLHKILINTILHL